MNSQRTTLLFIKKLPPAKVVLSVIQFLIVHHLTRFHNKFNRCSLFTFYDNVSKRWYANKINSTWCYKPSSYCHCFNSLIKSSCSYSLQFRCSIFPKNICELTYYLVSIGC